MDLVDPTRQVLGSAVIPDHVVGRLESSLTVDLRGDDGLGLLDCFGVPLQQPRELPVGRAVDDEDPVEALPAAALHQQGNDVDLVWTVRSQGPGGEFGAYGGVQDLLEQTPLCRVGENDLPQAAPVEPAGNVQDARTDCGRDPVQGRLAGLDDVPRDLVRVDDDGAARSEQVGDSRLPAGDTARESDREGPAAWRFSAVR